MSNYDTRYQRQKDAITTLKPAWDAYHAKKAEASAAWKVYTDAAESGHIDLCCKCRKPMSPGDGSSECDGCHLPWGWCTAEGRKNHRLMEIDAQIAALNAEKDRL